LWLIMARWAVYAAYVAIYVLLDWVSYIHPVFPLAITLWNPPPALSLVLLLRWGSSGWPALVVAALLAEWLVRGLPAPLPHTLASSLLLAGGYWALARLLTGPLRFNQSFLSQRDLLAFLGTVVSGTLLIGLVFVGIYAHAGLVHGDRFLASVVRFWIGDMIGVIVLVPLLLVHRDSRLRHWRPTLEQGLQLGSIALVLWIIFGIGATDAFKFFYLLFLPLVWIAMRHGIRGATLANLAIQLGLIGAVLWLGHRAATVLEFQFLTLALVMTGLFLGMAVTERRQVQATLQDREAALGQALKSAAVGEMASAMAHELNQPLMATSSYARACQHLLADGDRERLTATLEKLVKEVGHAGDVVLRLRDAYRGEGPRREDLQLRQFLPQCLASLKRRAELQGIQISVRTEGQDHLHADPVQLNMVVHNLVSNAIEALAAVPAGVKEIQVEASLDEQGRLRLCVQDSGPGVDPQLRGRLFQSMASDKPQGMGLGLAICRSLVESQGGRLWHEPLPGGCGARFCMTLPAREEVENGTDRIHSR
jgi:signal transduction histidine kinase